jgi:putative DNA primase/helicase
VTRVAQAAAEGERAAFAERAWQFTFGAWGKGSSLRPPDTVKTIHARNRWVFERGVVLEAMTRLDPAITQQPETYAELLDAATGAFVLAAEKLNIGPVSDEQAVRAADVALDEALNRLKHGQHGTGDAGTEGAIRVLDFSEMVSREAPKREFIADPWLYEKALAMVFAWRGVGKTLFGLWLAFAIATGGEFLRYTAPRPRRVLYADGEMSFAMMQERVKGIQEAHGGRQPEPGLFRIITPDEQPLEHPIPDLSTPAGQSRFEETLQGVEVLFLDNVSTLFRSRTQNEQEAWMMIQPWALSLRRRGIVVVFVHHAGKGGDQRGDSAREDCLDVVVKLTRPQGYRMTEGARFQIEFTKARGLHGPDVDEFEAHLGKDAHGNLIWSMRDANDTRLIEVANRKRTGLSVREISAGLKMPRSTVQDLVRRAESEGRV